MPVVEYKFHKIPDGGMRKPDYITDAGYSLSPVDFTFIGWLPEKNEREYEIPHTESYKSLSRQEYIDRQLSIHASHPFQILIDPNDNESGTRNMTEAEVEANAIALYESIWNNNSNVAYAVTAEDVNRERQRRIDLPINIVLDGKAFPVDMDNGGRQNIGDLGTIAIALTISGDTTTTTSFRDANNVDQDLTPPEIISMGIQCAAVVESYHIKARALKAMLPIPLDYTKDSYWT